MAASYLVDTNVIVHAIRQKKGRWEFLEGLVRAGGSLSCSVLTVAELYTGIRPHEKARTEELLNGFSHHDVTEEIARYAGLLKNEWTAKGFTFTLVDMIIASTAIAHQLTLVTENRKDFPMPELMLHDLPVVG